MLVPPIELEARDGRRMRLRALTPSDAAAWRAHAVEWLGHMPYIIMAPDELPDLAAQKRMLEQLDPARGDLLCGLFDLSAGAEQIVGDIWLTPGARRKTRHVATLAMSLRPDVQGVGLGRAMLEHAIAWAQQHPEIERIHLSAMRDNHAALALYRSTGFTEEAHRAQAYRQPDGSYQDEVLMSREVR